MLFCNKVATRRGCDGFGRHKEVVGEQVTPTVFESAMMFKVKRKGGNGKKIVGSVTSPDVVHIMVVQIGRDVDNRTLDVVDIVVTLPEIRDVWEFVVELKLGDGDVYVVECLTGQTTVMLNLSLNSNSVIICGPPYDIIFLVDWVPPTTSNQLMLKYKEVKGILDVTFDIIGINWEPIAG